MVLCNFFEKELTWKPEENLKGYVKLIGNYSEESSWEDEVKLRPFETIVLYQAAE